jgi:hypothetical protein
VAHEASAGPPVTRAQKALAAALHAREEAVVDRAWALHLAKCAREALASARRHVQAERQALIRWGYEVDRERTRSRRAPGAPEDPVWESVEAQVRHELNEHARELLTAEPGSS